MASAITAADLVQALRQAYEMPTQGRPAGAMRTEELAEALGVSEKTARKILRRLKDEGRVEVVEIPFTNVIDRVTVVRGFRLKVTNEDN